MLKTGLRKLKGHIRKLMIGYDIDTYHFSHSGEDAVLSGIFGKQLHEKQAGFFVDIGAYHPYTASNTFLFYINGWRGINIDARPGVMKLFDKHRPKDVNLEIGIGEKRETLTYYYVNSDSSMNSFSREFIEEMGMMDQVKKTVPIEVIPLSEVLGQYLEANQKIDFLNIDVEGYDFQVIKSNDWIQFRPKVVVIELPVKTVNDIFENKTAKYLLERNYEVVGKTVIFNKLGSVIFVDKDFEY